MHPARLSLRVVALSAFLLSPAGIAPAAANDEASAGQANDSATTFRQQVEPVLAQFCVKCHSGDEPEGELALAGFLERASLAADRETWDKIAQRLRAGEMPPEDAPQLATAERERLVAWLEAELAKDDCKGPRDPGRVTLRRLNRNEYNNTIRDLVGIDFQPADDFPSDDVGYGFDNIGDVLSLPPILLEKYLTAAETIVARALGTDQANLVNGEVTGGSSVGLDTYVLASQGEVSAPVRSSGEGLYILRVRAYGDQAGDEPVKMGLLFDGKPVRTVDVRAVAEHPEFYEAWIESKGGKHTVSASFLNDYYRPDDAGPNDRNLYVGGFELTGPYPETYRQIILREQTPEDRMLLAREIVNAFMTRAFRRPSTAAEVDRVLELVTLAQAEGESFAGAIGLGIQAMLVSPHFLFRVELDPEGLSRARSAS